MLRVAINGYGRIGRNLHRILLQEKNSEIEIVAINNRSKNPKMRAHLLKYDSLHGKIDDDICYTDDELIVNGHHIKLLAYPDPLEAPFGDLDIDVVISATGRARTKEDAQKFLDAGAKKVLVSAPMKDDTPTFVFGVNDQDITDDITIMSNASCTTNCIAPPLKVLHDALGISNAFVTSIHSFTHSQNLLDNTGSDLRRCRSAVQSVIPTTSGAMKAISLVVPELQGKVDGLAFRVPIATSSVCDIRFVFERNTSVEELNELMRSAAERDHLKSILSVCDEELVSIDFKTDRHSSIVDMLSTKVVDGKYAQMLFWYDNEWGYATRIKDFLVRLASFKK